MLRTHFLIIAFVQDLSYIIRLRGDVKYIFVALVVSLNDYIFRFLFAFNSGKQRKNALNQFSFRS